MSSPATRFYVTGGALPPAAPSYVPRQADDDLFEGLKAGEFGYVLTSRQMGKSSLMVQVAKRLRAEGVVVIVLDLTAIGRNVTVEQWYHDLLGSISQQLRLEDELDNYWETHARVGPLTRWHRAIREIVLHRCPSAIAIFVDEIDYVRGLGFSTDEFFAAIRECYNRRAEDAELGRLTFCLLGVATPSDLIRDPRTTPFNIGRCIELHDFSVAEASVLAKGLGHSEQEAAELLERVLYWTGGHPILTQRLCQAISDDSKVNGAAGVDHVCANLFLSQRQRHLDDNLVFVRERLLNQDVDKAALLDLYERIHRRRRVFDDETNPLVSVLHLAGATRVERGWLRVRNRIYERVFDRAWVRANMPDAELRRQRAAFLRGLFRGGVVVAVVLTVITAMALYIWRQKHHADLELATRREETQGLIYAGQSAMAAENWQEAWTAFEKALAKIGSESSLAELQKRANGLLGEATSRLAAEAKRRQERDNYEKFLKLREGALFHATLATGEGVVANLKATKESAGKALALFGLTNAQGSLALELSFRESEKAEIIAGCYELLLILAEAEAQPEAEAQQPQQELQAQLQQALRILDRAANLSYPNHPTQAYYLRRARYLKQLGDSPGAQEARDQAATREPVTALDYYLVGDQHYKQGNVPQAIRAFQNALRRQPDHFWARYFLSVSYLRTERPGPDLAKAELTTCLSQQPGFYWLYLLRGFAQTQLKEFQAAEEDYKNAENLLQKEAERALQHAPNRDALHVLYANRGVLWFEQGRYEKSVKKGLFFGKAIADLQDAIKLKPKEYLDYVTLAHVYQEQGKWDEAVKQLDEAIRLEPKLALLYRLRALLYVQRPDRNLNASMKDTERAIEEEKRAGNSATLAACYTEKGRILYLSEKYLDAVTACDQAVEKDPNHTNAYLLRAEAMLKQLKFEKSADSFDQYHKKGGRLSFEFYRGRGFARARCEKYLDAIDDYARALEMKPDDSIYAARGWANLATGAYKNALHDFDQAILLNPQNTDAYKGRGYACVKLGEYGQAVGDAEAALKWGPKKSSQLLYDAARIYAQAVGKVQAQPLTRHYQDRAVQLIRESLDSLPPKERGRFWRDKVFPDSALSPIQRSTAFLQLRAEYSQWAK